MRAVAELSLGYIRCCGGCCVRCSINASFFPLFGKFHSCSLVLSMATVKEESLTVRGDWLEDSPVKSSKVKGPSTTLTFLGILLDTTTMEASITQDCKQALLSELHYLRHCRNCTKRALLSLIGKLSFCCKVLPAGRIFLRRVIV